MIDHQQLEQKIVEQNQMNGPSMVLLVKNLDESIQYWTTTLGFTLEVVGGHAHVTRGTVTFILHPAKDPTDVRPNSTVSGLYFDAFCYTNPQALYSEYHAKGVEVTNGPNFEDWWKEFTIRDIDGYLIAFGGE